MVYLSTCCVRIGVIFAFFLTTNCLTFAHGDLHERIQKVTKEIKTKPDSAYLYFKRGVLYLQHEEYPKSLEDLKLASKLDYKDVYLDLNYAKVYLALNQFKEAIKHIDKILLEDNNHVNAWKLKGTVFFEMKEYESAAMAFLEVIEKANETFPFNYLDVSLCYELQKTAEATQKAIEIIERGIKSLGPLLGFYDKLVALHISTQNYENALIAQNKILELSNRLEKPLYNRAQLHLLMGNQTAALQDFEAAKMAILNLLPRLQKHLAMRELLSDIENEISQLEN